MDPLSLDALLRTEWRGGVCRTQNASWMTHPEVLGSAAKQIKEGARDGASSLWYTWTGGLVACWL